MSMFRFKVRTIRRASSVTKDYVEHKEAARALVLERLHYFNQYYGHTWKRVAIRNPRRSWGSCTSLGNLNFSYKLLYLPPHLSDYVIVHELCHLKELHHKQSFWDLVGEVLPDYKALRSELRSIEKGGSSVGYLIKVQALYRDRTKAQALQKCDVVTS